jgi:hypothetical protein
MTCSSLGKSVVSRRGDRKFESLSLQRRVINEPQGKSPRRPWRAGDTARAATSDEVKDLRCEASALKEAVAELIRHSRQASPLSLHPG